MNKSDRPARIVVTRTDEIESLLQEVWRLKPEIRNRISLTAAIAFMALIRETARERAILAAELPSYQTVAAHREEDSSPVQLNRQPNSAMPVPPVEPHPDAMWN